jgi:hypothetical protein
MKLFLIAYDMHKPVRHYDDIIDALEKLGARRILRSDWILAANHTAEQILSYLRQFQDEDDELVVIEITTGAMWGTYTRPGNLGASVLKQNRP